MSLKIYWSDRLEHLAEGLFGCWEAGTGKYPFARTCIVVGDMATRDWLQRYFLLNRKPGSRRILANIDFKPISEFDNVAVVLPPTGENPLLTREILYTAITRTKGNVYLYASDESLAACCARVVKRETGLRTSRKNLAEP